MNEVMATIEEFLYTIKLAQRHGFSNTAWDCSGCLPLPARDGLYFCCQTLFAVGFSQPLLQRADFCFKQGLFVLCLVVDNMSGFVGLNPRF